MWKRLFNRVANNLVTSHSGVSPWLHNLDNPFIYNVHLQGVADPFDGDALWEHEYGGGNKICDSQTKRTEHRLRLALEVHRQIEGRYDKHRQHQVEDQRAFADVLIRIPYKIWRQHQMIGSGRIPVLLDKLTHRHKQEFQGQLLGDRAPSYQIVPEAALQEDEVLCQFGLGVFIPNAEDHLCGEVRVCVAEQTLPLPEWQGYQTGRGAMQKTSYAAGIYKNQHYLLLATHYLSSAIKSPLWLANDRGYLLVDLRGDTPALQPEDGPIQAAGATRDPQSDEWHCRFRSEAHSDQAIELVIRMASSSTGTTLGLRSFGPRLCLSGIALPDPRCIAGLAEWALHLNPDGTITPNATAGPTLKSDLTGQLHLQAAGTNRYKPLSSLPQPIVGNKQNTLPVVEPFALADYLGLLRLPSPNNEYRILTTKAKDIKIGRDPGLGGIKLHLLAQMDNLLWDDNPAHSSLNSLVSARFARLQSQAEGLQVWLLSDTSPLYILDDGLQPLHTINPGNNESYLVKSGQYLLLRLYLLRYQAST